MKRSKTWFYGPMWWIGCSRSEKLWSDFVARTFALIAIVQPDLHWLYFHNKQSQMHPNTMKRTKTWVNGPIVWIGCARCEKFWSDFVARPFALIAPVQPIFLRVSCSKEMIPNPPKHYEMHQNTSLGSDGVDRVDLSQKILTQLCGTNFCINCNSSACFEPSIIKQRNDPKCAQTLRNTTKHEYWVQWGGSGVFIAKIPRLRGSNFCNNCTTLSPFCTEFHTVTK